MKKKGLIISTIVMVVVLIACLSTATYAWFSSTATVTINNINVQANATKGVEIGVKTTDIGTYPTKYLNGEVDYTADTGIWGAAASGNASDGFGSLIDFAAVNIGTIENAVTVAKGTEDVYSKATVNVGNGEALGVDTLYLISGGKSAIATQCKATDLYDETKTYYSKGTVAAGTYIEPIGYNSALQPNGYYQATPNDKYYDIPFGIKPTDTVNAIACSITLTDNAATSAFKPGMAAAARVEITIGGKVYLWQPYQSAKYTTTGMNATYNESEGTLNFVLAKGTLDSTDIVDFQVKIWVEGTDAECNNNLTKYTNFTVNFSFTYTDEDIVSKDVYNAITLNAATYEEGKYYTESGGTYTLSEGAFAEGTAYYTKSTYYTMQDANNKDIDYLVTDITATYA